jgi:glycosyltransferase involved in cell wall biosynthesis
MPIGGCVVKILHMINSLQVGGAERALSKLILSADKEEFEHVVIVLTSLGSVADDLMEKGFEVKCFDFKFSNCLIKLLEIITFIKNHKPDIVHTWLYHSDLIGSFCAYVAGVRKIVWGIRTTHLNKNSYVTALIRQILAFLSYFIPSSIVSVAEKSKEKHISLGYCRNKIIVIGNGFEINHGLILNREEFRQSLGLNNEHFVIGTVGRFSHDKGQDIFIKALSDIAFQYPMLKVLMVGKGIDIDNDDLFSDIKDPLIKSMLICLGERKDVYNCFSAMDAFCLPSRTEGFPNVLGEAMLMKLPCLATDVGDVRELLNNIGIVVSCTEKGIADGLLELLSKKNEELIDMGLNGHNLISSKYSLSINSKKFHDVYLSLL